MHRPIIVLHLILCIAFTVFLLGYFESLYPKTDLCNKLLKCTFSGNASCPSLNCTGDKRCCDLCEHDKQFLNRADHTTEIHAVSALVLATPLNIALTTFGFLVSIYGIVLGITIFGGFVVKHRGSLKFIWIIISTLLSLIALGYLIFLLVLICALLSDYSYYKHCQTDLIVLVNWTFTGFILFIDYLVGFWPHISMKNRRTKLRQQALEMENGTEAALLISEGDRLRPPCRYLLKIVHWMAGILLLWWLIVVVYFVGVGEAHWRLK